MTVTKTILLLLLILTSFGCNNTVETNDANSLNDPQESSPPTNPKDDLEIAPLPTPIPIPESTPISKSKCDSNYSGCVPIASDVDCAGGSGNGPAYVSGPIRVIGEDIYDLDRDGDGIACE